MRENLLEVLFKYQWLDLTPSGSKKFPGDTDAAGSGPVLRGPLQWRNRKHRRQGVVWLDVSHGSSFK